MTSHACFVGSTRGSAARTELLNLHRAALPQLQGVPEAFDLACWSQPVQTIGGDLLVAWPVDESRLVVGLFDVMGHGTPAAVVASSVRAALHPYRLQGVCRPAVLLDGIHRLVSSLFPDYFVTATVCLLDAAAGALTVAQAGHPPVLIRSRRGDVTSLSLPSSVLGFGSNEPYEERTLPLESGAAVVVYSDGISDALGSPERPGTQALSALVQACPQSEATGLVECIRRTVGRVALVRQDDHSVFAVRLR